MPKYIYSGPESDLTIDGALVHLRPGDIVEGSATQFANHPLFDAAKPAKKPAKKAATTKTSEV